jgi:hypothetical protein
MAKKNKILALIIAFVMLCSIAFSAIFIVDKSGHICSGNDCQICYQIGSCLSTLNNITPKPNSFFELIVACFSVVLLIGFTKEILDKNSLISLKVKLSN